MNARFTEIIITADNGQQVMRRDLLEFVPRIHRKKTMISAYFTRQGFVFIETFPEIEQFNFSFFTQKILSSFVLSVSLLRPKMQADGYWLDIDNAELHNSPLSLHKTEELGFTRLPSHSIILTWPRDFFRFGYLKKEFQEMNFRLRNGVISALTTILNEISVRTVSGAFD
jgi:hypothetical protein